MYTIHEKMQFMVPLELNDILVQPEKLKLTVKNIERSSTARSTLGSSALAYRTICPSTPTITIDDGKGTVVTLMCESLNLQCLF